MATKKLGFLNRVLFWGNLVAIACLLLAYLAPLVSPSTFSHLLVFGLLYPVFLAINLLFVFYWLMRRRRQFLLSLLTILLGWNSLLRTVQVDGSSDPESDQRQINLMSFNVRLFDLYNWSNNEATRDQILDFLKNENPDIICFQEYFHAKDKGYFDTTDTLKSLISATNVHAHFTRSVFNKHQFGIATFTKYPIVNEGLVEFESSTHNTCIYTDIKIGSDTIRVFNMHLASLHFGKQDYKFINEIEEQENEERIQGVLQIYSLVQNAARKRANQAEILAKEIENSPYRVLVCGDFNDTPASFAYHKISAGLTDAFMNSGFGFGSTYNGRLPLLRIDHILHSPSIESYEFQVQRDNFSDHYPLTAVLQIPTKAD